MTNQLTASLAREVIRDRIDRAREPRMFHLRAGTRRLTR